jgi:hypothetical protein
MPKTREELQKLTAANSDFLRILDLIWMDIKKPKASCAALHVINLDDLRLFPNGRGAEIKDTLISVLMSEYPGCDVRYYETLGFKGTILERLILIDWSLPLN